MPMPPRSRHDPFARSLICQAISVFGTVEVEHAVESGTLSADVWFAPRRGRRRKGRKALSLWGRQCETPSIFEVFSRTPGPARVKDVVVKAGIKERALRDDDDTLTPLHLWILSPGKPEAALTAWEAQPDTEDWLEGFWRLSKAMQVHLIVIRDLPDLPSTLIHRLLGRGDTLQRALEELAALRGAWALPFKENLLRRRIMLNETTPDALDDDDKDTLERLTAVADKFMQDLYKRANEDGEERGEKRGERRASLTLLARQAQLRLGHPLTVAQRAVLEAHIKREPPDALADKLLLLTPEELVEWLSAP